MLGGMLLTWDNLAYYQDLMAGMRAPSPRAGLPPSARRSRPAGRGAMFRRCRDLPL